jgi:hypothetical protein
MGINPLSTAHFARKTRCNMCCFPSYNSIGFQPQILKKAGGDFASSAEAIHGVAVPRHRQFLDKQIITGGSFFSWGVSE